MKIKSYSGSVDIELDLSRIQGNLAEAQKKLNMQIVADCEPLIPFQQGDLRNSVVYPRGIYGGEIEYNTPYAHYQYAGELYLAANGSSWAARGEKKYPSGIPLNYHVAGTTSEWFEEAKQVHKDEWLDLVRRTAGKE